MQHSGKIFLGQADIRLSELGKIEAAEAGHKILALAPTMKCIYTSDLARAKETAEIIAEKLEGVNVVPDKLFREMAMGTWDGELIEDIKAKFPEEYAKRGDDMRNYRTPGGENFYELRGRVLREFHRIFRETEGDLVIVAHLGVLVVLSEELLGNKKTIEPSRDFPTGSVTVIEAPEWLWPETPSVQAERGSI